MCRIIEKYSLEACFSLELEHGDHAEHKSDHDSSSLQKNGEKNGKQTSIPRLLSEKASLTTCKQCTS